MAVRCARRLRPSFSGRSGRDSVLFAISVTHFSNDACFALLYPLLPFIAKDLRLSYADAGLLKATFSGSAGLLQVPAGVLASRVDETLALLIGNAWVGSGLMLMAVAGAFPLLLAFAILGGVGGNLQHPLAASIVSKHAPAGRLALDMGTLNYSGDLGKLASLFVAGILATKFDWRITLGVTGAATVVLSLALLARRNREPATRAAQIAQPAVPLPDAPPVFSFLLAAGGLDSAARGATLTFLPFVFANKGLDAFAISGLLAALLAAGVLGKFACGWLTDRWGVFRVLTLTESVTASALMAVLVTSGWAIVPATIALGFVLNGTSSSLNVAVACALPPARRAPGFGAYFTVARISSATASLVLGVVGDLAGLPLAFVAMAVMACAAILVVVPVRQVIGTNPWP
jgi:FSR family fosmidomycin resistance protein-like MFS transporter